tara:strand:- start:3969 stop:4532 length:564 start_codon:yes stop_codon:yes gene_type:complete
MKPIFSALSETDSLLLVVDMQEKLLKSIQQKEKLIFNIKKLVEVSNILKIKIIYTEQNPDKLGITIKQVRDEDDSLIFKKMSFSCCGAKGFVEFLKNQTINTVVMCGIESHVCVQQTAIELNSLGYNVVIPIDAISSRKEGDNKIAIRRMENSSCTITSTEASIFEWCKTADRIEFKKISEIIKQSI